jgi:hypothetical protein
MIDKPDPLQLANELEQYATSGIEKEVAHAVRDLIMENQKLKNDLHHYYMLAANAEAELVDELQKENQQLAEFVIAVGGFWGHSRSKLVGEDSLAECINRGNEDEDLLKQALAQLEINRTNFLKGPSKSICKMLAGGNDEAINAIRARLTGDNLSPVANPTKKS